jgi:hypothetical protein
MKRQYSDYHEITKQHFFSLWEKELKVTAITHNCKNPLEESYVLTTLAEMEAFVHDQAFMMGVFMQKIKYPPGKTIVAQYIRDMDVQKYFVELHADATSEVVAQINEFRMEDTLHEMDAGPDKWSNRLEAFLDSFVIKLAQLNDMRSSGGRLGGTSVVGASAV